MRINKRQLKKWIAALDSGKFSQTTSTMHGPKGYCCLGVGCAVLIKEPIRQFGYIIGGFPTQQPHAPKWFRSINGNFAENVGFTLSYLNDSGQYSFTEIATLLELVYIHKILD
jgi:hypothetical protein